ncbi:MAG: hypothetical protein QM564_01115 [Bergeyella sp.]
MRSLTLIGFICIGIAAVLFYFNPNFKFINLFEPTTLMGILAGIGLGLLLGSIVGYISKGSAIREEQKRKEMKQLQKEKQELEKQAAELAKLKSEAEQHITTENPQN